MQIIDEIEAEHEEIRTIFMELEGLIDQEDSIDIPWLTTELERFRNLWNVHELKEEQAFRAFNKEKNQIPIEKFVTEHRELRGHLKVIDESIASKDHEKIKIALDTDGKMLIDKFKKHMDAEEMFFEMNFKQ